MQPLWEVADFVRTLRRQMRFGEFSRAPLRLLRVELRENIAECDWMARAVDPWDADLSPSVRDRNLTEQALRDAMNVRDLLFSVFPDVATANIRVYREGELPSLIIAGMVKREEPPPKGTRSLAMRVKLCGLQFRLDDGRLEPLPREGPT
jgi:hypothetical protein